MEISIKVEKIEKRGGKREGAGRKPMENPRNIRVSYKISQKAMEGLSKYAEQNGTSKNDALNQLLESL